VAAVGDFVAQYNEISGQLAKLGGRDGLLQGDGTLRRLQTGLRRQVMDNVDLDGTEYTSLGQLGIDIDRDGVMTLDEDALAEALRQDPEAVRLLFSASEDSHGTDGVAPRLGEYMQGWLSYGDGVLSRRDSMYDRSMKLIDNRVEAMERRVEMREESLRRQFVLLEQMLSTMQNQGQWLQGQIDSLSSITGDRE
ncbi:MAG: flagellar filament capping protein FliD, partial [Bacillota bacterium]